MERLVLEGRVGTLPVGTPLEDTMRIVGAKVVAIVVGHIQLKGEDHQELPLVLEEPLVAMVLAIQTIIKVVNMEVPVQEEVQIQCQAIAISHMAGNECVLLLLIRYAVWNLVHELVRNERRTILCEMNLY